MASLTVSPTSYEVSSDNKVLNVTYSTDVTLKDIKLSKDNINYINNESFTQNSARFNISSWNIGVYNNCTLKGTYGETVSSTYGNIIISTSSININEGGTTSFTVKLDKAPTNTQVVNISVDNSDIRLGKTSLTFTSSNYNIEQIITVNISEDSDYNNETGTITLTSSNVNNKTINVNITDNDEEVVEPPISDGVIKLEREYSVAKGNELRIPFATTIAGVSGGHVDAKKDGSFLCGSSIENNNFVLYTQALNIGTYENVKIEVTTWQDRAAKDYVKIAETTAFTIKVTGDSGDSGGGSTSVQSISLNKNNHSMNEGDSITLTYTITPSNATNKNVTWSSTNSNVASVNSGYVQAINKGNCVIRVTTEDGNKTSECNVTVNAVPSGGGGTGGGSTNSDIVVNPSSYTVNNDILTVNYTTNSNLSEMYMAVDDEIYDTRATSFSSYNATFNVSNVSEGEHTFKLRGTKQTSDGGGSGNNGSSPSPSDSFKVVTDFNNNISPLIRYDKCSNGYGGMTMPAYSYAVIDKYLAIDKYKMMCEVEILDEYATFGFLTEPIVNGVPISSAQKGALYLLDNKRLQLYDHYKGYMNKPSTVRASTNFDIVKGKKYRMNVDKRGWIHKLTITEIGNESNTASVEYTNDNKDSSTEYCGKGWGLPGVCCFSGQVKMTKFEWDMCSSLTPRAIIIGDSITEGTNVSGGTGTDDKWSSQVRDKYYGGDALICGRGWATTNDVKLRLEALYDLGVRPKEDIVVLVGTNDVRANDASLEGWKVDMESKIVPYITDQRNFNANPVICCLPLCQTDINNRVRKANEWILSKGWTSPRFDKATSSGNDGITYDASCFTDGLHPNKKGSDNMYAEFTKAMK